MTRKLISQFPRETFGFNGSYQSRPTFQLGSFTRFNELNISDNTIPLGATLQSNGAYIRAGGFLNLQQLPQFANEFYSNGYPVPRNLDLDNIQRYGNGTPLFRRMTE